MSLRRLFLFSACLAANAGGAAAQSSNALRIDDTQARAALAVMDAASEAGGETARQRQALLESRGYRRLKAREDSFRVGLTDAAFLDFLRSPEQTSRRVALADALARWRSVDIGRAEARARAYLPRGAPLRAEVFFLIKPKTNSFVWDLTGEPGVFLYLDPEQSAAETENTIAHELHHIGLGAACQSATAGTDGASQLRRWSGAFGEGLAMMAAAGGPDVHPHADGAPEDKARWDADVARFGDDLGLQDALFVKVARGQAGDAAAIAGAMREFYGEQGPWYTVGWKMAQVIERAFGRERVIDAFCRPGAIFGVYNDAAKRLAVEEPLPLWSDIVVATALTLDAGKSTGN